MTTNKKIFLVLGLLAGLHLSLYGIVKYFDPAITEMPDVEFIFIDGTKKKTSDFTGRPVLVVFWATSCKTCVKEIPHLIKLYNELHPKGLEIIGVAMPYDLPTNVITYAKSMKIPYPVALDVQGKVVQAFGKVQVTPTTFLISPKGKVERHVIGKLNMDKLRANIVNL